MTSKPVRKQIDEDRAAALLGVTRAQLRMLSEQSGATDEPAREESATRWFTYQELYRICCSLARTVVLT